MVVSWQFFWRLLMTIHFFPKGDSLTLGDVSKCVINDELHDFIRLESLSRKKFEFPPCYKKNADLSVHETVEVRRWRLMLRFVRELKILSCIHRLSILICMNILISCVLYFSASLFSNQNELNDKITWHVFSERHFFCVLFSGHENFTITVIQLLSLPHCVIRQFSARK